MSCPRTSRTPAVVVAGALVPMSSVVGWTTTRSIALTIRVSSPSPSACQHQEDGLTHNQTSLDLFTQSKIWHLKKRAGEKEMFPIQLMWPYVAFAECLHDEWQCSNGLCIPEQRRCDGHFNCYDMTDEYNCGKRMLDQGTPLFLEQSCASQNSTVVHFSLF